MQYLETKLILKPDRFKSVESFREFGKIVKRVAKHGLPAEKWSFLN